MIIPGAVGQWERKGQLRRLTVPHHSHIAWDNSVRSEFVKQTIRHRSGAAGRGPEQTTLLCPWVARTRPQRAPQEAWSRGGRSLGLGMAPLRERMR